MANPNFTATMSSNEIWRDLDDTRCITDDLDTIESNITALQNGKADNDHTHGGYAEVNHSHEYAPISHGHSYNELSDKPTIPTLPFTEDTTYPGCFYRTVNGVTEWINPPMIVGTEYRTIERWNGKVVYTILVDCGAISNQKAVTVENISQTEIFKCEATVGGHVLPYKTYQAYVDVQRLGSNNFRFYFYCGGDIVGQNVRARAWYVKD